MILDIDAIPPIRPTAVLVIDAGEQKFYAHPSDNAAGKAFFERLKSDPLTVTMRDSGDFAKTGLLPFSLPGADAPLTTAPGDLLLYEGNRIALCYDRGNGKYTRLAAIGNTTKEKLSGVFGNPDITLKFYLEWSE